MDSSAGIVQASPLAHAWPPPLPAHLRSVPCALWPSGGHVRPWSWPDWPSGLKGERAGAAAARRSGPASARGGRGWRRAAGHGGAILDVREAHHWQGWIGACAPHSAQRAAHSALCSCRADDGTTHVSARESGCRATAWLRAPVPLCHAARGLWGRHVGLSHMPGG